MPQGCSVSNICNKDSYYKDVDDILTTAKDIIELETRIKTLCMQRPHYEACTFKVPDGQESCLWGALCWRPPNRWVTVIFQFTFLPPRKYWMSFWTSRPPPARRTPNPFAGWPLRSSIGCQASCWSSPHFKSSVHTMCNSTGIEA